MKSLIIFIFLLVFQSWQAQTIYDHLVSKMDDVHLLDNGNFTNIWAYGTWAPTPISTLPAPLLIYQLGDSVELEMTNLSQESHTIHLHGLDVNQINDGVPQTSFFVTPNSSATYRFRADEPGTYLYHCHVTTTLHLTMGMYGMVVVERPDNTLYESGPEYAQSYYYLCSDLEIETNDSPISAFPFHEIQPDYFMINGLRGQMLFDDTSQIIETSGNENTVLRLGNMAYAKTEFIFPSELNAIAHMSDGRIIPTAFNVDTLEIYPGERYSVLINPNENVSDYIQVNYYSMENNLLQASNFIGVNSYDHPLSIEEYNSAFSIYPNPSTGIVNFGYAQIELIEVIDVKGRLIKSFENRSKINLEGLRAGLYFLRLNQSTIKKLVIE